MTAPTTSGGSSVNAGQPRGGMSGQVSWPGAPKPAPAGGSLKETPAGRHGGGPAEDLAEAKG